MVTPVSTWGNIFGIRTPRDIAYAAQITEGTQVDVRIDDGRIVLDALRIESLERLPARVTPENLHGEPLADAPVGRELARRVD